MSVATTQKGTTTARTMAIVAAGGFLLLAGFQLALAIGAPWGRASYAGTHEGVLPVSLRLASVVAVAVWGLAALVVLARGGVDVPISSSLARWGTWFLVGLMPVAFLMNVASSSPWERFGWAPFSALMFLLCLVLARSPLPADRAA
jgi:hypothetical protein